LLQWRREVGAVHRVEQGQQRTLAPVEGVGLGDRPAPAVLHELQPAVPRPAHTARRAQREAGHLDAEPGDQAVEQGVLVERTGLVHEPVAAGEAQDRDRPVALVGVAQTEVHPGQRTGPVPVEQPGDQVLPVGLEPRHELHRGVRRVQRGLREHPGQHRVRREERGQARPAAGGGDERGEPLARARSGEPPGAPGQGQLVDQGPGGLPDELLGQPPLERPPAKRPVRRRERPPCGMRAGPRPG